MYTSNSFTVIGTVSGPGHLKYQRVYEVYMKIIKANTLKIYRKNSHCLLKMIFFLYFVDEYAEGMN